MALPNINHSLCAECGGLCCQNSGCALIPSDISDPFRYNKLLKKLKTGKYSFRIAIHFNSFRRRYEYQLRLCIRNKDRDIIDLFSPPNNCSLWSPTTGCPFSDEERPYQGLHLIPAKYGCHVDFDKNFMFEKWGPVQVELEQAFKEYSDKSVLSVLSDQYKENLEKVLSSIGTKMNDDFGMKIIFANEQILKQHGLL